MVHTSASSRTSLLQVTWFFGVSVPCSLQLNFSWNTSVNFLLVFIQDVLLIAVVCALHGALRTKRAGLNVVKRTFLFHTCFLKRMKLWPTFLPETHWIFGGFRDQLIAIFFRIEAKSVRPVLTKMPSDTSPAADARLNLHLIILMKRQLLASQKLINSGIVCTIIFCAQPLFKIQFWYFFYCSWGALFVHFENYSTSLIDEVFEKSTSTCWNSNQMLHSVTVWALNQTLLSNDDSRHWMKKFITDFFSHISDEKRVELKC